MTKSIIMSNSKSTMTVCPLASKQKPAMNSISAETLQAELGKRYIFKVLQTYLDAFQVTLNNVFSRHSEGIQIKRVTFFATDWNVTGICRKGSRLSDVDKYSRIEAGFKGYFRIQVKMGTVEVTFNATGFAASIKKGKKVRWNKVRPNISTLYDSAIKALAAKAQ